MDTFTRILLATLLVTGGSAALAQSHRGGHGGHGGGGGAGHFRDGGGARSLHFDGRFQHDRYYPGRGHVAPGLPNGALRLGWHGQPYYYRSGAWFRPYGPRWQVVVPPFGIVVPFLPGGYASLWIGGAPYYYANNVYYAPAPGSGYTVVPPPEGADQAVTAPPPPAAPDPVIYPRNGQSAEQTEADRQQCNTWATTQPKAVADAAVFQRAVAACMDARGYTVK